MKIDNFKLLSNKSKLDLLSELETNFDCLKQEFINVIFEIAKEKLIIENEILGSKHDINNISFGFYGMNDIKINKDYWYLYVKNSKNLEVIYVYVNAQEIIDDNWKDKYKQKLLEEKEKLLKKEEKKKNKEYLKFLELKRKYENK